MQDYSWVMFDVLLVVNFVPYRKMWYRAKNKIHE